MASRDGGASPLLLVQRFPALASLPRASLGRFPTPVVDANALAPGLWIKRDDLTADSYGGNKVRPLEFLLAGVARDEHVVTAGARGSTHALATAIHARRLGARVSILHWPQEMTDTAESVRARTRRVADEVRDMRSVATAMAAGLLERARGARWIPPGGSTALGALGSVNAALELAAQVRAGVLPMPRRIVLPLGSGGTTAGLLLGAAIAGLDTEIVAVRVVPRIVGNRGNVLRLAWSTARLLRKLSGERVPYARGARLRVVQDMYGGAYGRDVAAGRAAAERMRRWSRTCGVDPTYSAKALATALQIHDDGPTLFWLTFDTRI